MSEVVTGPVPLPGEGQDITEISQRKSIREFVDYFQKHLPQAFRVDTASNQMEGDLREGDLLVACMVKHVLVMKARKPDSGKTVIIPINSGIFFALLPKDTHEVRLGASWEGTFTVAEMLRLTLLPSAAKVLSDCKDHDKKKVSEGTILYNLTTFTIGKVFKKRGVKGVSSFGVVHKFFEGEDVQFSTSQLDTKCNLVEIYDIFEGPLRARVFCEGGPDLKQNDIVVFEEKEERKFIVSKTLNSHEPSSSVSSIPTDLTGVQVTAVGIKGYDLEPLAKQKTSLKRQSSSRVIQETGNQYVYAPIKEDVRDEPPPRKFEDPEYDNPRKISSETARSMSTESLVSEAYVEMTIYYNVRQPSLTTEYPKKTRRRSEDIRDNLYHSKQGISVAATTSGTPPRSSRKFSDSAYDYVGLNIPLPRTDRGLKEPSGVSGSSKSLPRGPGTARCLTQPRVLSHHLSSVQEQSSELKPPNQISPSKPSPKPQVKPKPHQSPSPQTVTQEQRHPSPATPRQGKGPPVMPQVSQDKVPGRGTICTSSPGGPHSPSSESVDDGYEVIEPVTKPPPKPPVKPKPPKVPPNDTRFQVTPTNLQLLHHVARHTGYQWQLFCAFLGLERSCIDEADYKGNSLKEKCYEALLLWLQGEGKEPKLWTTILDALRKSNLARVALEIQRHITSGTLDNS